MNQLFAGAVLLCLAQVASSCSCPQHIAEVNLRNDPIYQICRHSYLTRVEFSKLENYTCQQDDLKNTGCFMQANVLEDFFAPLNETDRNLKADRLEGDLNGAMCGVKLPEPGEYITNAYPHNDIFRENGCLLYRVKYSEEKAKEIREIVKKCPKQRRSWDYWETKGMEIAGLPHN